VGVEIHGYSSVPIHWLNILDMSCRTGNAYVVNEYVEATVSCCQIFEYLCDLRDIRYIGLRCHSIRIGLQKGFDRGWIGITDIYAKILLYKCFRHDAANPGSSGCDQHDRCGRR
jgi:hypothetical protein